MIYRFQTVFFTLTVFLSAFLLFSIQPMFAKIILPAFGGSAAVWTTCMLFFQLTLLLGYIYAHFLVNYLPILGQVGVHLALIFSATLFLPFSVDLPSINSQAPIKELLLAATVSIGWPFFVISTTAPLLQRWFSVTTHPSHSNPYFLYGASNLGSMIALLAYPFLFEFYFGVSEQKVLWFSIYLLLSLLYCFCVFFVCTNQRKEEMSGASSLSEKHPVSWALRLLWVILAFVPSSLMLGLTSFVTTDIAAISFFWIVPLALYLLTFILVFSNCRQFTDNEVIALVIGLCISIVIVYIFRPEDKLVTTVLFTALVFILSLFIHGQLAAHKGPTSYLTEFYIWLAVGGMLGGLFNAVLAPLIFKMFFEFWLALVFALFLLITLRKLSPSNFRVFFIKALKFSVGCLLAVFAIEKVFSTTDIETLKSSLFLIFGLILIVMLLLFFVKKMKGYQFIFNSLSIFSIFVAIYFYEHNIIYLNRSFYSSIRILRHREGNVVLHSFHHGTTLHGQQIYFPQEKQKEKISYFHSDGAFGDISKGFIESATGPLKIAILGLGSGALSCFARGEDQVTFFEIDDFVEKVANDQRYFTYLALCPAKIVIGDGRLAIMKEPKESFDILYMDAFSSDAVPTHLLTQEAIMSYFSRIKNRGLIVIHVSNRYLNLVPVIANYDLPDGYVAYYSGARASNAKFFVPQEVAILVHEEDVPENIRDSKHWRRLEKDPKFKKWTDDYTNIARILRFAW